MALFEKEFKRKPGTRSNTKLVVSGGDSPAEKWITDPTLPVLFNYDYAPPAEKEVVIAKGMMVAIGGKVRDDETGTYINTLTIADADAPDNRRFAVGMAPYNFSKRYEDFLYGNQPAIITREYVELPLFRRPEDAAEMKWGAVFGNNEVLKGGDYVKVAGSSTGNAGKLTKWDPDKDPAHLIVGQILATDENQEPFGWLKWAMYPETLVDRMARGANRSGYSAPGDGGFPFDPEYKNGLGYHEYEGFQSPYVTNPTGMPGLLDGSQKAQTQQTVTEHIEVGDYTTTPKIVNLLLKNIVEGTVKAYLGGVELVEGRDFDVDYKNGLVFLKINVTTAADLVVNFRAHFYGTPAGWDFKGAVGVARVLLKL